MIIIIVHSELLNHNMSGGTNMKVNELFKKPIDREIQGVVKIGQDQESNTYQELDEYVITSEIRKNMGTFFEAYVKSLEQPTDQMGVWISGFFGSGKSHFLKILSYLIDSQKTVKGRRPISFIEDKFEENDETLALIKRASEQPNQVALFNIESKAEADSMNSKSAVVKVFNKVLNELRGFSGANAWIAEMEETLANNGQYEQFKTAFERIADLDWVEGREEIFYNEDSVIEALSEVTEMTIESARHFIESGEANYEISDESFAKKVKRYVDQQPDNYHLVFLADEMGQYIADNGQLMLDLQMVVEDLAQYCQGKVWVVVTSQQDIDSLNRGGMSSNDFSKIQGRFNTRLPLSSANADEVIKKRLLAKTEEASAILTTEYTENEAVLKNKILFTNDTAEMKSFDNVDEFIDTYPFVPYQFNLLQKVFMGIRGHGFAGKHLANGERSLLSAAQYAAQMFSEQSTDFLVPFSVFYENIENALEYSVQTPIIQAKSNKRLDKFDVEVLKLLFLIRYVQEIPSNIDNLTTLMIDNVDAQMVTIKSNIQESLKRLEREFLIQRQGTEYVFLTNEEQDINRDIQSVEITNSDIVGYLGSMIYTDILGLKQYTYKPFKEFPSVSYNFEVNQIVDNIVLKKATSQLTLQIYTPLSLEVNSNEDASARSMEEGVIVVRLPESGTYLEDIQQFKRIDQYLREAAHQRTDSYEDIVSHKGRERTQLSQEIKIQVMAILARAEIYVNGSRLGVAGEAKTIINQALKQATEITFSKLKYIKHNYHRDDLEGLFSQQGHLLDQSIEDPNELATEAILKDLEVWHARKQRVSLKSLLDNYKVAPFGWQEETVLASLIRLLLAEKIQMRRQSEKLIPEANLSYFISEISRSKEQEKIAVEQRDVIQAAFLRTANQVVKAMFNIVPEKSKDDDRMNEIKEPFRREIKVLNNLLMKYSGHSYYPGETSVKRELALLESVWELKDAQQFFERLAHIADELLETYDDNEDVKQFFSSQYELFEVANELDIRYQQDQDYLTQDEVKRAGERIHQIVNYAEPYQVIKELKSLNEVFLTGLTNEIELAAAPYQIQLEKNCESLLDTLGTPELVDEFKEKIIRQYAMISDKLSRAQTITEVRGLNTDIITTRDRFMILINEFVEKQVPLTVEEDDNDFKPNVTKVAAVKPIAKTLRITHDTVFPSQSVTIKSEADIDRYVAAVRAQLEQKLADNDELYII